MDTECLPEHLPLTIEIYNNRACVRSYPNGPADSLLRLPSNSPPADHLVSPAELLRETSFAEAAIVIGRDSDPFFPALGKFDTALHLVEQIIACRPETLTIRTRSPLILLAAPLLRAHAPHVAITVAFETGNDSLALRHLPHLPRPSERFSAARVLRTLGIPVTAQVTPLLVRTISRSELRRFGKSIAESCDRCIVAPFHTLEHRHTPAAPLPEENISQRRFVEELSLIAPTLDVELVTPCDDAHEELVAA